MRFLSRVIPVVLLALTGCNLNFINPTPTIEAVIEENINPLPGVTPTVTLTPSPLPTASLTPTAVQVAQIATAPPTNTPIPTIAPTPTETPGPWEYTIQSGDTLIGIIQQAPFNYRDTGVIAEIVRINPLIPNENSLPGPGNVILIPRQTATPIPAGADLTATVRSSRNESFFPGIPANTQFECHNVEEGESLVGIIERYGGATLALISQLNRDIVFTGCNFEEPSGGPNCNPLIRVGQCVRVPFPTPTPTLSPTPSGNETPTLTPTFSAPSLVFPPSGAIIPPASVSLQWVSVGLLTGDQAYLVEVFELSGAVAPWASVTRATSLMLPEALIPTDGAAKVFRWRVTVAQPDSQGLYSPIGGRGEEREFTWQSR